MTLTSETVRQQFSGTGSQTTFSITYVFWDLDDVDVTFTDANGDATTWVRGTQYNITNHIDGEVGTGDIEVVTAPTDYTPASGTLLTALSDLTYTQDTSLPQGGAFPSASVEQQLDQIVRQIQQLIESIGRALKFGVASTFSDVDFPDPTASTLLAWNSAGDGLENVTFASISVSIDTTLSGEADGDILQYDGTTWRNETIANTGISEDADIVIAQQVFGG